MLYLRLFVWGLWDQSAQWLSVSDMFILENVRKNVVLSEKEKDLKNVLYWLCFQNTFDRCPTLKKIRGLSGRCAPLTFYKLSVSWSVRPMCSVYVFKLRCSMKVSNTTLLTYYSLLFIFYKLNQTTRIQRIQYIIVFLAKQRTHILSKIWFSRALDYC